MTDHSVVGSPALSQRLLYKVCCDEHVKHVAKGLRLLSPLATRLLPGQQAVWQQSWQGKLLLVLLSAACL